jgi:predicted nucleotidyltransferase
MSGKRASPKIIQPAKSAAWRDNPYALADITPIGCDRPVSETLPLAIQRIARALEPERIILFGSYAYGKPTPDSDVDLLVVMNTAAQRAERYLLVSRVLTPRPFAVDILVRTPQEIEHARAAGDLFIGEIVDQGKVLYERRA